MTVKKNLFTQSRKGSKGWQRQTTPYPGVPLELFKFGKSLLSQRKMLSSISISSSPTATFNPKLLSSASRSAFNGLRIQQAFPIHVPLSTAPFRKPSSPSVVMMAKKDEELKEVRSKTTDEINEEVVELKGELLMLRLQQSARNEFKSSEFRRMRKRVCISVLKIKIACCSNTFFCFNCSVLVSLL